MSLDAIQRLKLSMKMFNLTKLTEDQILFILLRNMTDVEFNNKKTTKEIIKPKSLWSKVAKQVDNKALSKQINKEVINETT